MNQLLENVITNPAARSEQQLLPIAAQSAVGYLPWSDEA